jgi:PAS domain S-box-containing protein
MGYAIHLQFSFFSENGFVLKTPQTAYIQGLFKSPVGLSPLLDEIPLGIVVLGSDRRILSINRTTEALTGFAQEEARGIPCHHILRSNLCFQTCPLLRMGAESEPICLEGNIINRDRQKIPVRVTFSPIKDFHGHLTGFLEAVEDIRILQELDAKKGQAYSYGHLIARSPQMERVFQILPGIAQTDSSVLVTGETGTGKDLLAEAIHQASNRAKGPFIKVNCGALPETLLESELFGHERGAFTGAVQSKPGRFRLAHNGTLFLTEIGDLPLSLQVKLLTFLDDKVVYPLGSTKGIHVDVRTIAATHRDLERMVKEERFRQDLLFRLNVVRLHIPPLRERGEDVRLLLDHFLLSFTSEFKKPITGFSEEALKLLLQYPYPGNVRELRNIVEYAANICQEDTIQLHHLPAYLTESKPDLKTSVQYQEEVLPAREETLSDGTLNWPEMERKMILDALIKAKGRRSEAAALLGWGRSTLWRKMKQYEIAP